MKHIPLLSAAIISFLSTFNVLSLPPCLRQEKQCSILIASQWTILEDNKGRIQEFGTPTIIANITFKKYITDQIDLNSLRLKWHGPAIDHVMGSLYRRDPNKKFLPLQNNLICDGVWKKTEQTLILDFVAKQSLSTSNTFCLVLNVSPELKTILEKGKFTIYEDSLPDQFRSCAQSQELIVDCSGKILNKELTS